MQHETGAGEKMQARQRCSQAFVITGEPAEARSPGEVAFDDPAFGQQDEASLGFRQLDDGGT